MLELKLFGHVQASGPGGKIDPANAKLSGFLAYLALAGKRPVPREQLTELLWGSHFEEQARQNFRQALSRLRKLLGAEIFSSDDQFIQLNPQNLRCDVRRFESLAQADSPEALQEAVTMAEGELLEGVVIKEAGFSEWLSGERRRVSKLAFEALIRLGEIELAGGSAGEALKHALAAIARDEFDETGHRLAMRAYGGLGKNAEALKHFHDLRDRLLRTLGAAPAAETSALADSLQNGGGVGVKQQAESGQPSIAVMPFDNLSNDPEQDYFADGMVDEIITALSRFSWLKVIARYSTFTYKGRAVDARQVGTELGVRYVLEGSVRKERDQLRINGHLIDAATGGTIWADRFDGRLENVFELQDQVSSKAVSAIAPKLEQVEAERARKKPTESLDAYDHFLRGLAEFNRWNHDGNRDALKHFYRAIELDRRFGAAYGMAARVLSQRKAGNWCEDMALEKLETEGLVALAVEFGRDDPIALSAAGIAIAYVSGRTREGGELTDRALALNPNLAMAWGNSGWIKAWSGEADEAIARVRRAISLNPADPYMPSLRRIIAMAHFVAGRYEQAIEEAHIAADMPQATPLAVATAAACSMLLGREEDARAEVVKLQSSMPGIRLSNLRSKMPPLREEDFARFAKALQLAGLPD